jgi:glycine cleavage system aminomethyltransferase T
VGVVTSGCPSPTLGEKLNGCIAMGFVDRDSRELGSELEVDTGKGVLSAKVAALPFYKAPKPA